MYPTAVNTFAREFARDFARDIDRDSSLADIAMYRPLILNRRKPVVNGTMRVVAEPDDEVVRKLNEIAKRRPFSTYCKNRKYDPL